MKKVLFVCIHNSGRSQMAEAFLNTLGKGEFLAESAGFEPGALNPVVVEVLKEDGIDISGNSTDSVFEFFKEGKRYNYVVTVCDEGAAERCPIFPGVTSRIHMSFPDPSLYKEDSEENRGKVREIKEGIKKEVEKFIELVKTGKLDDNAPIEWRVTSNWTEE